ncbi:hypothetical protein [Caldisericum sp.]|uniref:hypothetical protein n=1 Tax=Caldisericum sp. TaxID=2499687 RepID=UPI003D09B014
MATNKKLLAGLKIIMKSKLPDLGGFKKNKIPKLVLSKGGKNGKNKKRKSLF